MKTELTDNEIRVRIAEACGWRNPKVVSNGSVIWAEHPETGYPCQIPLYLTSLDAMAEAEKWLFESKPGYYERAWYANLVNAVTELDPSNDGWGDVDTRQHAYTARATARQRALAFLATIAP